MGVFKIPSWCPVYAMLHFYLEGALSLTEGGAGSKPSGATCSLCMAHMLKWLTSALSIRDLELKASAGVPFSSSRAVPPVCVLQQPGA